MMSFISLHMVSYQFSYLHIVNYVYDTTPLYLHAQYVDVEVETDVW